MKTLADYINEAKEESFKLVFLTIDEGAWAEWEDENFTLSDLEEQMIECPDKDPIIIKAKNENNAIKQSQKILDKEKDIKDCMAASLYYEDGEICETLFSKSWMKFIKEND